MQPTAEHRRLTPEQRPRWHRWGTYVASRSWGTVRESGTVKNKPWLQFPFEQARSRAYRWTEDGIAGFCDQDQVLCMAPVFWNGLDPILKERFFGLSTEQGNHGEDLKEYFFYIDGLPSYSYVKMLYKYPQAEFPYARLVQENALAAPEEHGADLLDLLPTTFENNRYFDIAIEYAKASPEDILCRITAYNRGDQPAPLHILPQIWFRNTWFDGSAKPELGAQGKRTIHIRHDVLGERWWHIDQETELLFTENETNMQALFDQPNTSPYVKDGIDLAIIRGQRDRVNPANCGTKAAAHCQQIIQPGESWTVRFRLQPVHGKTPFADFDTIFEQRHQEADEFYAQVQRDDLSPDDRMIQRAAFAGLSWNRNFYHFKIKDWLKQQENSGAPDRAEDIKEMKKWQHFDAHEVISIPDPWEYPWFAAWDLNFQYVTISLVDPQFTKDQILMMLSPRFQRKDGALPAFEGDPETPHPPIHAWAAWHVYKLTGTRDIQFLQKTYEPLKRHHKWWMETQKQKHNLFGGGFLGVDNGMVFNRNSDVPKGMWLAQADGTAWMALFNLNMLAIAIELGEDDDAVEFLKQFWKVREALETLWDDKTGFFYDSLYSNEPNTRRIPIKVRNGSSLVGFAAVQLLDPALLDKLPRLQKQLAALEKDNSEFRKGENGLYLLTAISHTRMEELLKAIFDSEEFKSRYGLRSLSKYHAKHPVSWKGEDKTHELTYEPGETTDKVFGGNSNWRGPIWTPFNQLVIEALHNYDEYFGSSLRLPGKKPVSLKQGGLNIAEGMIDLFRRDEQDRRPFYGDIAYFQTDPHWRDCIWFREYFHAETGEGLGALHQNGWTALVAKLIHNHCRAVFIPAPFGTKQPKKVREV